MTGLEKKQFQLADKNYDNLSYKLAFTAQQNSNYEPPLLF